MKMIIVLIVLLTACSGAAVKSPARTPSLNLKTHLTCSGRGEFRIEQRYVNCRAYITYTCENRSGKAPRFHVELHEDVKSECFASR